MVLNELQSGRRAFVRMRGVDQSECGLRSDGLTVYELASGHDIVVSDRLQRLLLDHGPPTVSIGDLHLWEADGTRLLYDAMTDCARMKKHYLGSALQL
jgi:hypothetical protein